MTPRGDGFGGPVGSTFKVIPFDQIDVATDGAYLIKNLIPREGLIVVWGPPKCGKSFWVADLALHIALDWEYRDLKTKAGPVVYVACEGERGIGARIAAFRKVFISDDASRTPFYLIATRLDLAAQHGTLRDDIAVQVPERRASLIVIDTLNRSLAGSESKDEDMAAYIKAADAIREAFQCAVILIHHCGVETSRPRGHTSLAGAADAQIKVTKTDDGLISAEVELMKDGEAGTIITSRLEIVDVAEDEDGEIITSCVIRPTEDQPKPKANRRQPLAAAHRIALDQLRNAINQAGTILPGGVHVPENTLGVAVDIWRRYFYEASTAETQNAKKTAFGRASDALQAKGHITIWSSYVWIVPSDTTAQGSY